MFLSCFCVLFSTIDSKIKLTAKICSDLYNFIVNWMFGNIL